MAASSLCTDFRRQAPYNRIDGEIFAGPGLEATRALEIGRDSAPGAQGWVYQVRGQFELTSSSFGQQVAGRQTPPCGLDSGLDLLSTDRLAVFFEPGLQFLRADRLSIGRVDALLRFLRVGRFGRGCWARAGSYGL